MSTKINSSFGTFSEQRFSITLWCLGVIRGEVGIKRNPSLYATMATVENALNLMQDVKDNEEFFVYPPDADDFEASDRLTFTRKGNTIEVCEVRLGGVTHKLAYATALNSFHPSPAPEQKPISFRPFSSRRDMELKAIQALIDSEVVYTNEEKEDIVESYRITPNRWLVAGIIIEQSDNVTLRSRRTGEARKGVTVWELLLHGENEPPFVEDFESIKALILWDYSGELGS